jgi:hypothetical protein
MEAQLGEIEQNSFRVYCAERRKADTEDMIERMRWDNYRWYCSSMCDAARDPTVPVVHIPLYVMLELEQTTGWGDAMCIAFGDYWTTTCRRHASCKV